MRRLKNSWETGKDWPKRLEWIELTNLRGWKGQRVDFDFPIVALVGENGAGKSTILQAAAAVYRSEVGRDTYASDFFPDTPFERVTQAKIRFSFRQGQDTQERTVRKPTQRWRGNPQRPRRHVEYVDLRRSQPVGARSGYAKLLKRGVKEGSHSAFSDDKLERLNDILGKDYVSAGISVTNVDTKNSVPVLVDNAARFSGFHQGAGEITAAELLASDFQKTGLVLIDEIETSLHPRAQRRLMRDLATVARKMDLQIVMTTHSPYILAELPSEARLYIMEGADGKDIVKGVSPDFAMSQMDEEHHPECDIYVEDERAATLVSELIISHKRDTRKRACIIPYGAASVGKSLGMMASQGRFPRPSVVFLDGDQTNAPGCILLPGGDAPERVVFEGLRNMAWPEIYSRVGRGPSETIDALERAMTASNHKEWVQRAADALVVGGDILWQALAASWAASCVTEKEKENVIQPVVDALAGNQ